MLTDISNDLRETTVAAHYYRNGVMCASLYNEASHKHSGEFLIF